MLFYVVLFLCVATALAFTIKRNVNVKYSDLVLKLCASMLFTATGVAAIISNPDVNLSFALMILLGLFFGVLGDVFVEMSWLQKEKSDTVLVFGFVTFMLQHVVLTAGVFINYPLSFTNTLVVFTAPLAVLLLSEVAVKITKMKMGKFKVISNLYGAVTSMTFSAAFMVLTNYGMSLSMLLFFAGGVAFFISDLVLSQVFFTERGKTKLFVVLNNILYYCSQILFASSIFFME